MDISTIIPVYNAAHYLECCLDSLIGAQVSGIENEIILINDGSSDNSPQICAKYASKFENIYFLSQENQGPSAARNVGIKRARGRWISFVDSDDFVKETYFENYADYLNEANDLIMGGFKKFNEKLQEVEGELKLDEKIIKTSSYDSFLIDFPLFNFAFPVAKLFKRDILELNAIEFPTEVKMYEDSIFLLKYLSYCNQIHLISTQDYYYIERKGSLTGGIHGFISEYYASILIYRISVENFDLTLDDLKTRYHALGERISNSLNRAIIALFRHDYSKKEYYSYVRNIDKNCIALYRYYHHPQGLVKKMIKLLVVNKKFNLLFYFGKSAYKFTR